VGQWVDSFDASLIRWIAILPLVSAFVHGVLIGLARVRISDRSIWAISLFALSMAFALSGLSLLDLVNTARGEPVVDSVGPWLGGGVGAHSLSAELAFQLDPLSGVFCLVVTSIALSVYLFTIGLMRSGELESDSGHRSFAMLDLLVGTTLVAILADNFLLFFLGWAGVGFASQLFASFDLGEKRSALAGATTFVIARIGDLGLLGATLLLFDGLSRSEAPAVTFRGIQASFRLLERQGVAMLERGGVESPLLLELVGLGLVLAAITKCAQLPLHIWLPDASKGPVPATALMHSTTSVLVGVYALLRFSFLLASAPIAMSLLVWLGAATMLLASMAAATQLDWTRLVAYATSSQLGLVLVAVGLGAYPTAAFLLLTHAFVKAHLVLAMGFVVLTLAGETDLRKMGGLGYRMRWTQGMVALAALALIGFPPLAGFFSIEEALAFVALGEGLQRHILLAIALASLGILAFAMTRVFHLVFWGNVRPGGLVERKLHDPTGLAQHGLTALAVMTVAAGLLSPSQFWGDLTGVAQSDSIGHFLVGTLAGQADPALAGGERMPVIAMFAACLAAGIGLGSWRYARRGYRGEPKQPATRFLVEALREILFLDRLYELILVRPLRRLSSRALEGGIERRLLDRVVVSGSAGLARRMVWSGLRRLQNGRLQSYALLGILTVLVVVTWMVG
jgi:NADH-quinone oxidoreductase subunit L